MKLKAADHLSLGTIAGTGILTAALYARLPDRIPMHFDIHGEANGWMARAIGAWLFPALSLGLWLLLRFGGLILPLTWKERMMASPTAAVGAIFAALFAAVQGLVLYAALVQPPTVAVSSGLILGVFWVVSGIMDFFTGVFVRDMPRRGWVIFTGILGFVAGLIVLFQPAISLFTLAWVLGIWLIIYGTMEIVASFSVRKLAAAAA